MLKIFLSTILFLNCFFSFNIRNNSNIKETTTLYQKDDFTPSGWHGGITSNFIFEIANYYRLEKLEVRMGVWFNRDYGWWYYDDYLNNNIINNELENGQTTFTFEYGVKYEWSDWRKEYYFWVAVNEIKEFIEDLGWGSWYIGTSVGGVSITTKARVYNNLKYEMHDIYEQLNDKPTKIIETPDPYSNHTEPNKKRVREQVKTIIGQRKYDWLRKSEFYSEYAILYFQTTRDYKTETTKVKFNFKYQLWKQLKPLEQIIQMQNNKTITVTTHTYSLRENENQVKTAIKNLFQNQSFEKQNLVNFISDYDFKPASLANGADSVDVYFKKFTPNNNYLLETFNLKINIRIQYKLDEQYFKKEMQDRISFETNGKKLNGQYNGYEVYSDEVIVKFRTNLQESEVLYINNQEIGVANSLFIYTLKDGRWEKPEQDFEKKEEELNTYEVKLVKKDAKDPKNQNNDIVWIKKIMIRKKAPQLSIKLWAENDEQNPNEIIGVVIYNPQLDAKINNDSKWLKDNESWILTQVNGLSASLMGVHNPSWDFNDNLIEHNQASWKYAPFNITKLVKQKIDLNLQENDWKAQELLQQRIDNKSQFFSNAGILKFAISDKLENKAIHYHLNLGMNNTTTSERKKGEELLQNIKSNLYYFWDSKLGKMLLNYLRITDFFVNKENGKTISQEQWEKLTKKQQDENYTKVSKYNNQELLYMPLHLIQFHIARMIRDLQYDPNNELKDKIDKENKWKDELEDKDEIKEPDEKDKTKEPDDKTKEEDNKEKEKDWQEKKQLIKERNFYYMRIKIAIIISTILVTTIIIGGGFWIWKIRYKGRRRVKKLKRQLAKTVPNNG